MSISIDKKLSEAIQGFNAIRNSVDIIDAIQRAALAISESLKNGGKLLICGNGGSAADAQHFAAELIGRFYFDRRPLAAIALSTDSSVLTCVANDYSFADVFSRQVAALAKPEDVLFGISTSGNSENVHSALSVARDIGAKTILLTGSKKGRIEAISDLVIAVPSADTPRIQEMHLFVEHFICEVVESALCK